jgi:hypothetical protein
MNLSDIPKQRWVTLIALCLLMFFGLAMVFPEPLWGFHFPTFLGTGLGWGLVIIGVLFTLYADRFNLWQRWEVAQNEENSRGKWLWIAVIALLSGMVMYQLPIFEDVYGDAYAMLNGDKEYILDDFTDKQKAKLWSWDFTNLKLGTGTTYGLVAWLSYTKEIPVYEAFRWLGVICGMGYVFFMLAAAFHFAKTKLQAILFSLLVLSSPTLFVFFGHVESYAPVYLIMAVFVYVLIRFMEESQWWWGLLLATTCLLAIKFHISGFLTLPVGALAAGLKWRKGKGKTTTWKQLFLAILLPIHILGLLVYALVTKSIFGTRDFSEENVTDAMFLPIKASDVAPLDRYNLFSWSHLFDYFNMIFLWSAAAVLVLIAVGILGRKKVNWNAPLVQISGIALLLYTVLFFVLNPLLSMPVDWDLMGIPTAVLIFFTIVLIANETNGAEGSRSIPSALFGGVLVLSVFGWTTHLVNAHPKKLGQRLISTGSHTYKTYWKGASTTILTGIRLLDEDDQKKSLAQNVQQLIPFKTDGNDVEYAALVHQLGVLTRKEEGPASGFQYSFNYFKEAYDAQPYYTDNVIALNQLMVDCFVNEQFEMAQQIAEMLLRVDYPSTSKALRVAIHIALEAEDYTAATNYCKKYLALIPDDAFIQEILELLEHAEDKSKIKLRFRRS